MRPTCFLLGLLGAGPAFADPWPTREAPALESPLDALGTCEARIRLDHDGTPKAVNVSGCEDALRIAATEGLQAWRWDPPGSGVTVDLRYTVEFPSDGPPLISLEGEPMVHHPASKGATPRTGAARGTGAGMFAAPLEGPSGILLTHTVPAEVPEAARAYGKGTSLSCTLAVVLKGSGAPGSVTPADCPPELVDSALKAVRKWRWSRSGADAPALKGWATEVTVTIRVH